MKLLFVWIEQYRNIQRQGFAVDDEYCIDIKSPDKSELEYVDSYGNKVCGNVNAVTFDYQYRRKIAVCKNESYTPTTQYPFLDSICALVGENAVGKSNILSCFTQRHERGTLPDDTVSGFFAFLDTAQDRILFRAQRMELFGDGIEQVSKSKSQNSGNYNVYEYMFGAKVSSIKDSDITHLISIGSGERFEDAYQYMSFGIPCMLSNLSSYKLSKKLNKTFEYLCDSSIKNGKKLVFSIKGADERYPQPYFLSADYTADERKQYFIKKLFQSVLNSVRKFLFQERDSSKEIFDEDMKCGEIISFTNCSYPHWESHSFIRERSTRSLIEDIDTAINFLSTCTYRHNLRPRFLTFLQQLKALANCLLCLPPERFTAFYKLELDFEANYTELIDAWQRVMEIDSWQPDWVKDLHVEIEWLSAGEEQQVAMFATLYQTLSGDKFDGFNRRHVLLLLDEPEIHMHPQTSHEFMPRFLEVFSYFCDNGYFKSCQIIMSTHSPFIVQNILNLNYHLYLVRKSSGNAQVEDLRCADLSLYDGESPSLNLILHYVFSMYTIELLDELYGYLVEKEKSLTCFVNVNKIPHKTAIWKRIIPKGPHKGETKEEPLCLAECVRHSIHHPENKLNPRYTNEELKESIDWMLPIVYDVKNGKYNGDC